MLNTPACLNAAMFAICLALSAKATALHAAVVLQYHHVSDSTPAATSVSPERFAMHLDLIAREGFEVVPLQQFVDDLQAGRLLPDHTVAITFDDGYSSVYSQAFPLLRQRGWPFTVFVNTEPHDRGRRGFLSWDQLREMSQAGATIANHTVRHLYLVRRGPGQDEQAWQSQVAAEIVGAQRRILREIGTAPKLLAWPYGEYDRSVLDVAESLGFTGFGQQSGPLAEYSDLRALPRFPFGGPYGDRQDFQEKLRSLPMPLSRGEPGVRWETAEGEPLDDIVLPGPSARPKLVLRFKPGFPVDRVKCFASGQGQLPVSVQGSTLTTQARRPLEAGRSRYNCTAPSAEPGRFYWLSQPWIVFRANPAPQASGTIGPGRAR
ncbi:MAG: polysaccharide deacetylase family protein [Lysobacterales bacterium]|jgi:peptidoglycan/xylan/chitin deacetylase (PgdA/CDA1 family)